MATYKGKTVQLYKPRKMAGITPAGKKKSVFVPGKKTGTAKVVHFGDTAYQDYTQHHNAKRRSNFRSRMNCASSKDKSSAKYWACRDLW